MSRYPGPVPVTDVHVWKTEATQRLLGYTITLTEDAWHQPSLLPGWSRAHVATHLARNADHLAAVIAAVSTGRPQPPQPGLEEAREQLESGADRTGLELQIDLDASAGALQNVIETVSDWSVEVSIDGVRLPLDTVPMDRLHEVILHTLDLDVGFTPDDVDPGAAAWLLRWALFRLRNATLPTLELVTASVNDVVGDGDDRLRIHGTDARVWAWLTGRGDPDIVDGAESVRMPLLG